MKRIFGFSRIVECRGLLAAGLLAAGLAVSAPAFAQQQGSAELQSMIATKLSGDRVQLQLQLNAPATKPLSFTVGQPASIALDLSNTRLALQNRETDINVGDVTNAVAAQAGARTRVVINLVTLVPYHISAQGNTVYVLLGGNPNDTAVADIDPASLSPAVTAIAANTPTPASSSATAPAALTGQNITNVDFRRGANGMGRVIVDLSTPSIVGNVHMIGPNVVVDFANTRLPTNLVRRMDVTDFATPVQYIDAENTPTGARLVIHPTGQYDKLAFQSDDLFAMEFTPVSEQAAQAAQQKQFTGQKISLNFQNIDIRAVLQILADASGKNIVVSDSVHGNITLRLQDVPWDQALDIIMKTKGLASRTFGNTLIIGTAQDIAAQEQAEFAAQQSLEQSAPLQSAFIQVNYAKASDIANLIKGQGRTFLSSRGSLSVDPRTNTLLVQDTAENIAKIRQMVTRLDIPVKQVLIQSRIVIAQNDYTQQLGVRFGVNGIRGTSGGLMSLNGDLTGTNAQQNAFNPPAGGTPVTGTPLLSVPALNDQLNVNVPTANPFGQLAFGVLRSNFLVDLELSAMAAAGKGEVVSSPRVITANAKEASIVQGIEIPYTQSASSGATTVSFKNAVLSLDVTPQITPDNRIIMDLEVHDDTVGQFVPTANGGSVPSINTRNVKTQVLVNDGDTVVLGGIYETTNNSTVNKVPLLGDIPLLGWLFRNTKVTNNKDELLIFVTPKIMTQTAMLGE